MLNDIPKMKAGVPEIEVTFELDDDGILSVSAVEKSVGSKGEITISNNNGRLSKEEVESILLLYIYNIGMLKEAEDFAEQDREAKERIDAKSALESYLLSVTN